jgi:plastocyanin
MPSIFITPARIAIISVMTLLAMAIFIGGVSRAAGPSSYQVSQRGRDFQPNQISIKRGDTLRIVNDDADLLHHAYVNSDKFKFDSNDIEPGGKVDVKFPVSGDFNVLCGIHPKMKLTVHVD